MYASVVGAAAQVGWISRWLSGRLPDRFATRLSDRRGRPTYMSARAFADTVMELMADDKLQNVPGWEGLRARLRTLDAEAGQLLHIKAGLESWFDETMARLSNAYKRWTTSVLFVVGLIIAAMGNVSTIQMAQTPVGAAGGPAGRARRRAAGRRQGRIAEWTRDRERPVHPGSLGARPPPGLVDADALGPTVVGRAACPGLGGHGAVGHARRALLVRCTLPPGVPADDGRASRCPPRRTTPRPRRCVPRSPSPEPGPISPRPRPRPPWPRHAAPAAAPGGRGAPSPGAVADGRGDRKPLIDKIREQMA